MRAYPSDNPISFSEFSKVLGSCRIVDSKRKPERRTYPSGGARFPVEIYAVSYNVDGLDNGAYHYNMRDKCLEMLLEQNLNHK
ncbi:MAG: nitroreductase, partial [Nanoarchaeota archaeon]|nr:nitroreductase [Nanoarchaeota archaeon]